MKISIIVPVYNVAQYLQRCIDSLIEQTYRNIEIILVNDGSTDSSLEICERNARIDSRIRIINKINGGLSDARNCGLKVATGDYVLFVDSDDYIEVDACEKLLSGMYDNVDFVVGAYTEISDNCEICKRHTNIQENIIYSAKDFVIHSIETNEWYAPAWLNLYRKDFLIDNQLYYKVGYLFEDHEMLPRLYLAANSVVYVDYPFYNYVIRPASIMTTGNLDKKRIMSNLVYDEWMEIFSKVQDFQYQKYLYGILIRYYLRSCCSLDVTGWHIQNMDFAFAFRYALNHKERLKVFLFNCFPKVYLKLEIYIKKRIMRN